jgi:RNA polymerase sigma-70 factor (ECF subfamily)
MDDLAFRDAVVAAVPRLRRLAHLVAGAETDPDDLVQDTLERAWRARDRFRADATVTTWLHRILVNRAADLCRRPRVVVTPLDADTLESLMDFEVDDVDSLLARAADIAELRAALSRLPAAERMVLALHDGEGWTARRVGEVCGLSTAAVHKRLQRARIRLARELLGVEERARRPSPQCRQVRAGAVDYVDGRLDDHHKRQIEEHIRGCALCPSLVQALIGLRAALELAPGAPEPPEDVLHGLRRL